MELYILETIKKYGFTIEQVANEMGISRFTLRNTIKKGNPTLSTLEAISDAVGCDFREFFEDPNNAKVPCKAVYNSKPEKIMSVFVSAETGKKYKIVEIED